jgi:hypothetical protein
MFFHATKCCGLDEFQGLAGNTPEDIMRAVKEKYVDDDHNAAFVLFTSVRGEDCGEDLLDYLGRHRLGRADMGDYATNPNTDNEIAWIVYTIDVEALRHHFQPRLLEVPTVAVSDGQLIGLACGYNVGDFIKVGRRAAIVNDITTTQVVRFLGVEDRMMILEDAQTTELNNCIRLHVKNAKHFSRVVGNFTSKFMINQF